ncbi:unnamed protein product [Amoebophrya sp. A120]|nr:unnamed protein product [Amoebophrya sp. A120]|eukprot:GSA120T00015519001.1
MILDSVLSEINKTADRTFHYVEQAFFQRWYANQNETRRDFLKALIKAGRFQFLNGGWVMHDEATAHFLDMIDQTSLGHWFLLKEFGVKPKIGWQLDPFGHSILQVDLFGSKLGFTGLFFGRIDYKDLEHRVANQEAEFVWTKTAAPPAMKLGNHLTTHGGAGPAQGKEELRETHRATLARQSRLRTTTSARTSEIFTGLTGSYGGNYGPPMGFWWDQLCDTETNPVFDFNPDKTQRNESLNTMIVERFKNYTAVQASQTRGNNILMTWGSDFWYSNATKIFVNTDELIRRMNLKYNSTNSEDIESQRVEVFYSTMEDYVAAKEAEEREHYHAVRHGNRSRSSSSPSRDNKHGQHLVNRSSPQLTSTSSSETKSKTQPMLKLRRTTSRSSSSEQMMSQNDIKSDDEDDPLITTLFPSKQNTDFFPYADRKHGFWTGYFTSRPAVKRMIRHFSSLFQVFKQFSALSHTWNPKLLNFADALGIAQHHDAVTGTEKQHVTFDYAKRLHAGMKSAEKIALSPEVLEKLPGFAVSRPGEIIDVVQVQDEREGVHLRVSAREGSRRKASEAQPHDVVWQNCILRNETVCGVTKTFLNNTTEDFYYTNAKRSRSAFLQMKIWNPLPRSRVSTIEIPVPTAKPVVVSCAEDIGKDKDIITAYPISSFTTGNYAKPAKNALPFVLSFQLSLPGLAFKSCVVRELDKKTAVEQVEDHARRGRHAHQPANRETGRGNTNSSSQNQTTSRAEKIDLFLENDYLQVHFCQSSGEICRILNKKTNQTRHAHQRWKVYKGIKNNTVQQTGAYIFRPNPGDSQWFLKVKKIEKVDKFEVRQEYAEGYVQQRVRLLRNRIEITHINGPLPDATELVTSWNTDVENVEAETGQNIFYTDANGREMLKRVTDGGRDFTPYNFTDEGEPIAGNYYPVVAAISIKQEGTSRSDISDATRRNGGSGAASRSSKSSAATTSADNATAGGRTSTTNNYQTAPDSSAAEVEDAFTILTDAAQGGASLYKGHLELMTHRSCLFDDARGVGEPLNETEFVTSYDPKTEPNPENRGRHYGRRLRVVGEHWVVPFSSPPESSATGGGGFSTFSSTGTTPDHAEGEAKVKKETAGNEHQTLHWRAQQEEMYAKPLVLLAAHSHQQASREDPDPENERVVLETPLNEEQQSRTADATVLARTSTGGAATSRTEQAASKKFDWDPSLQLLTFELLEAERLRRIVARKEIDSAENEATTRGSLMKMKKMSNSLPLAAANEYRQINKSYLLRLGHNGLSSEAKSVNLLRDFVLPNKLMQLVDIRFNRAEPSSTTSTTTKAALASFYEDRNDEDPKEQKGKRKTKANGSEGAHEARPEQERPLQMFGRSGELELSSSQVEHLQTLKVEDESRTRTNSSLPTTITISIWELSLSANQLAEDAPNWIRNTRGGGEQAIGKKLPSPSTSTLQLGADHDFHVETRISFDPLLESITLNPFEIRTFGLAIEFDKIFESQAVQHEESNKGKNTPSLQGNGSAKVKSQDNRNKHDEALKKQEEMNIDIVYI